MRIRTIALSTLAIPLAFTMYPRPVAAIAQPGPAAAAIQDADRDAYRDIREQGHHDGMKAAYDDMRDHRNPDPKRHDEYRHPPVDHNARDAYRDGFRDGYNDAFRNGPRHDDDDDRH